MELTLSSAPAQMYLILGTFLVLWTGAIMCVRRRRALSRSRKSRLRR